MRSEYREVFDEMRAEMYWLGKTCPMPWMLGETAFSADDDTTDHGLDTNSVLLLPEPMFHKMPWMQGNEDQQVAYAFQSMDAVRNSMGSGYSWWDFQSNRNNPVVRHDSLGQPVYSKPLDVSGNWLSPLGYGDGVNPWRLKKLADTLDTYVLPPEAQELPPAPYNYPSWLGFESEGTQTWGWVRNTYGEPIADAVIEWGWRYNNDGVASPLTNPEESAWDRITTFEDGYFQVPLPPQLPLGWIRNDTIVGAFLSAHGGMGYQKIDTCLTGTVFEIERHLPLVHETVPTGNLGIGDTARYRAYNDLSAHGQVLIGNGTEGAVADYSARFNVHVTGEFHAQQGTEAHFFNEQIWPDCGSPALRSAAVAIQPSRDRRNLKVDAATKGIQLKFSVARNGLRVEPNPAQTILKVTCTELEGTFHVIDSQGRECLVRPVIASTTTIDVSTLAEGRYEIQQRGKTWSLSKSFVIVR